MKNVLIAVFLGVAIISCNKKIDFSAVEQGMNKQEVIQTVGEPSLKQDIGVADLWTYREQDRTIIFRADTVYDIITSREARTDSIRISLKNLGENLKEGTKKLEEKLDSAGDDLENKLKPDTNKY